MSTKETLKLTWTRRSTHREQSLAALLEECPFKVGEQVLIAKDGVHRIAGTITALQATPQTVFKSIAARRAVGEFTWTVEAKID